jgi:hypothetical protein
VVAKNGKSKKKEQGLFDGHHKKKRGSVSPGIGSLSISRIIDRMDKPILRNFAKKFL